jgi:hypothetical protein
MCRELEPLARTHAGALAHDASDAAVSSGQRVIAALAAACDWGR